MMRLWALILAACALCACERTRLPKASLTFERDGHIVRTVTLQDLASAVRPVTIDTDDPYYGRRMRFRALPIEAVLEHGFGITLADARRADFVLRATDGYAVPVRGTRLLEGGGYLAFDGADGHGFPPMGARRIDPAPFYMVWTGANQQRVETHPHPWQLTTISLARFEDRYAHVVPEGAPEGSPVHRGYEIVRARCLRCHAINREGGSVGPELNVPKSVVEYWSDDQLRAYIRDPRTFRYGNMPPHTDLDDADLDAIVAYLHAMALHKYDGGGGTR